MRDVTVILLYLGAIKVRVILLKPLLQKACFTNVVGKRDDNYVVRQSRERILCLQVLYYNLQSHLCQVGCEIKSALKI